MHPESLWRLRALVDGALRREPHRGKEHIVIPVVALVEGVIQCATCPVPELALATEFGKFVGAWNGRPVTVPHPEKDGQLTAAGAPDMLERFAIGTTFNARIEDKKLKVEAWIDPELAANTVDGPELLERVAALERGEEVRVEVSTGFYAIGVPSQGNYQGELYANILRDIKPDHLALLRASEIGACSWEDGCGVRPNFVAACACEGAQPTARATRSEADRAKRIADHAIAISAGAIPRENQERWNSTGISFEDQARALSLRLFDLLAGDLLFIDAVFANTVVYERWSSIKMFERSWRMAGDQVEVDDDVIEVRPETRFIAVESSDEATADDDPPIPMQTNTNGAMRAAQESRMDRNQTIDALIANAATPWVEEDRASLDALTDAQIERMASHQAPAPEGHVPLATLTVDQLKSQAERLGVQVLAAGAPTLTADDQRILAAARAERAIRKAATVEKIEKLGVYAKADLDAMELEALAKLEALVAKATPAPEPNYARPLGQAPNDSPSFLPVRSLSAQIGKKAEPAAA